MAHNSDEEKPWWRSTKLQIGVIVALGLIILGYWLPFPWIGFDSQVTPKPADIDYRPMRTFWDWLGLLIIPAVVTVGGWLFSRAERHTDHEIAAERARNEQKLAAERAGNEQKLAAKRAKIEQKLAADRIRDSILREYLDRMSELLFERDLAGSEKDNPVRYMARARTLTLLSALVGDGHRKGRVVRGKSCAISL